MVYNNGVDDLCTVDVVSDANGDHGMKKNKKDKSKYKVIPKGPKKGDGGQSAIRKKIRDTERLLKKKDLPANVKVDLERRVKALTLELSGKANVKVEVKMHQKYKYIKHVESKKVVRRINQLERRLKEMEEEEVDDNERDKTTRQLEKCRVQLAYIHFFPKDMKYVSLFPKTSSTTTQEDGDDHDNEEDQDQESDMSKRIRQAVLTRIELAKSSGELKDSKFSLRLADVFEGAERRKIEAARSLKTKKTTSAAVTATAASSASKNPVKKGQRTDGKVVKQQGKKGDTNESRKSSLLSNKQVTRDNAKKRTSHEMEDDDFEDDEEEEVEVEGEGGENEEVAEDGNIQGDEEEEDAAADDFFMSGDDGELADPKDLKFEDYIVEAPLSKSRTLSSTNTFKKRKLDKGMGGADGIAEALAPLQSTRRSRGGLKQKKKSKIY